MISTLNSASAVVVVPPWPLFADHGITHGKLSPGPCGVRGQEDIDGEVALWKQFGTELPVWPYSNTDPQPLTSLHRKLLQECALSWDCVPKLAVD